MPPIRAGQAGGGAAPEARGEGRRAQGLERPEGSGQRARTARPFLFLAHLPSSLPRGEQKVGVSRRSRASARGRGAQRWVCVRFSPAALPALRRRSSHGPGAPARAGRGARHSCEGLTSHPGPAQGGAAFLPGCWGGAWTFHLESLDVPPEPRAGGRGAGPALGLRGRQTTRMRSLLAQDQSHRCSLCVRSGFAALGLSMET